MSIIENPNSAHSLTRAFLKVSAEPGFEDQIAKFSRYWEDLIFRW